MGLSESLKSSMEIRWEFLRRDPQYKRDYDSVKNFVKFMRGVKSGTTLSSEEYSLLQSNIPPEIQGLDDDERFTLWWGRCASNFLEDVQTPAAYGLFAWLPPRIDSKTVVSSNWLRFLSADLLTYPRVLEPAEILADPSPREIDYKDRFTEIHGEEYSPDVEAMRYYCRIGINLLAVRSRKQLKNEICQFIDEQLDQFDAKFEPTKLNKTDYKQILRAGDLKAIGWTYKQIAKELFPKEFSDPDSAETRARQHCNRYDYFVTGGHRLIKLL